MDTNTLLTNTVTVYGTKRLVIVAVAVVVAVVASNGLK